MPALQLRLLVLLASVYLLPFVNAECSGYLNEGRYHPNPYPEKCWDCPIAKDGFGTSTIKYRSGGSYDNFKCKYSKSDGQDEKGKPYQPRTLLCKYNEKGELLSRERDSNSCASAAIPISGCTPVRPASGSVEFCCDPNCKLVTDQCWTCPKLWETIKVNRDWVDITVSRNLLACKYEITGDSSNPPTILFDAQTGEPVKGKNYVYGGKSFNQKAEFVPAQSCTPQPVKPETTQDDYRTFRGNLRCPSRAEYCNRRSVSDDCWICPKIKGYDAVDEDGTGRDYTKCQYYKRNASGSLEKANLFCNYNIKEGKVADAYYKQAADKECPQVPDKDAECMRLKGLIGN